MIDDRKFLEVSLSAVYLYMGFASAAYKNNVKGEDSE